MINLPGRRSWTVKFSDIPPTPMMLRRSHGPIYLGRQTAHAGLLVGLTKKWPSSKMAVGCDLAPPGEEARQCTGAWA